MKDILFVKKKKGPSRRIFGYNKESLNNNQIKIWRQLENA